MICASYQGLEIHWQGRKLCQECFSHPRFPGQSGSASEQTSVPKKVIFLHYLHIFVWIQHDYLINMNSTLGPSNSVIQRLLF